MAEEIRIATRKRLEEIERELSDLRTQHASLKARWELEKQHIQSIRSIKAEIEDVKVRAADAEREGDYGTVAELRYGRIMELEKSLVSANAELASVQTDEALLKEEIDDTDIADVVAKWTGIPVSRMLESERTKLLTMEQRLHERVIGQHEAVVAVSNAIRRSRLDFRTPNVRSDRLCFSVQQASERPRWPALWPSFSSMTRDRLCAST